MSYGNEITNATQTNGQYLMICLFNVNCETKSRAELSNYYALTLRLGPLNGFEHLTVNYIRNLNNLFSVVLFSHSLICVVLNLIYLLCKRFKKITKNHSVIVNHA